MNVKDTPLYKQAIEDGAKIKRVAGGVVFRVRDAHVQVLLIKRAADDHWPNHWEFPRGGVEPGEKFEDGLKREVFEEAGLKVMPLFYLDSFCYAKKDGNKIIQLSIQDNWVCKILNDTGDVKLSFEHDDFQWIAFSSQALLATSGEIQKTLLGFLEMPYLKISLEKFSIRIKDILNLNKIQATIETKRNDVTSPIEEAYSGSNYIDI